MADQAAKDAAAQKRIITHMNADHADSLSLYLRHYSGLSSRSSRGAVLASISLSSMTLRTPDGRTYTVAFDPPLTSYAQARERVVEMDQTARSALDISSIRITEYEAPRKPFHIFVFAICLFTFVIFVTKNRIVKGTWFYDRVLVYFPGGPLVFLWIANKIALPVLGIHLTEAWLLDRTRLRKYGVSRGTGLWFQWIASCFIEGYGCFQRIDATVDKKTKEKEKAKH